MPSVPKKRGSGGKVILFLFLIILIGGGYFSYKKFLAGSSEALLSDLSGEGASEVNIKALTGDYSAVFIDNGQVYFGKLTDQDGDMYGLENVFYLDTNQKNPDGSPGTALAKLGNEVHGPTDHMEINRDHILFIEQLKPDSKVMTAISDFYKGQK